MALTATVDYSVEAHNISHASENKIHDDTVARKLGFAGGLVPGVEVFAYASHLPVARWGRAFLERGRIACRFAKPVYDGRTATVIGDITGDSLELRVESDGIVCASGTAALPGAPGCVPEAGAYPVVPLPAERPPADETSLAPGRSLSSSEVLLDRDVSDGYLRDVREQSSLYRDQRLAHPGWLLRLCNNALRENVLLAPWIHTGSELQFHAAAKVGDRLAAHARVAANYERKGHRCVDLDCLIVGNGTEVVAHVRHSAIYRLRHLAA